ncbi:M48 family metallopeptidase [Patescibacteria group bacterium]|nr:M48 family metallopeptidase [Patescibacteria group bacterium]
MTLYTQAESNIRKTWLLLIAFLIFIIALGWLFSYLLDNSIFLILAVIVALLQSFFAYWYSDKIVLAMTRARPIEKKDNPELYRIVENLCIAAGLPLPKICIIGEQQPNAFATGRNAENSVVAVTQGLLEKLERPELEGVIAHELSHIGNKDMLLGTVIVILIGIVALISNWFLRISFWGGTRRGSRDSSGPILMILGIISAILAPIAATLIQLAVSRKREFLADASGALLTRYPEGLAKALEKISADPNPMRIASNSTAHLFIASPFRGKQSKSWFTKLFLTHPPVEERISALRGMEI